MEVAWTICMIVLTLCSNASMLSASSSTSNKLVWKVKPQAYQLAKEHESVKLNCEFEYVNRTSSANYNQDGSGSDNKYFVIWYKDGASQNVLSLNDQLAQVNSTNYEISGTYNLVIKNLTRQHSGVYTCQLFQSLDLVASVNLTVLVAPKYAKIGLRETLSASFETISSSSSGANNLVEGELAYLECCTNADSNPTPIFEWHRLARSNLTSDERVMVRLPVSHVHHHSTSLIKSNQELVASKSSSSSTAAELCNRLRLNLTRFDNLYTYRCLISNEALVNRKPIEDSISFTVEYKPDVLVHLASNPSIAGSIKLIANSSLDLYCNATARPNVLTYQWYFEDNILREHRSSVLSLASLHRGNSGRYECRCSNRHGVSSSQFNVEILYAEVKATNRTVYIEQKNLLRDARATFVSSYENASLTLTCQVESNPANENVMWYYHELGSDGHVHNQVVVSTAWMSRADKLFYSHLLLANLTSNHSGYYSCAISSLLVDSLNRTQPLNANATYFLLVQYAPIVRAVRRAVYANNYDQVELACEVKSNPQSIFSWYFGTKELFSSYKYNLSSVIYKQMHRTYLDDMENFHHYRSKLVINSLTQFDYGEYVCRANNIIGESLQIIRLKRKEKPETPTDLKAIEVTSNSVRLSWFSGSSSSSDNVGGGGGSGENTTYVITINNALNLTSVVDEASDDGSGSGDDEETRFNMIEIRGLHANQAYEFKIMAYNSLGASEYTMPPLRIVTERTHLRADHLPNVSGAQFNEQRAAICFDVDEEDMNRHHAAISSSSGSDQGILVRVEIDLDDEKALLNRLLAVENMTGGSEDDELGSLNEEAAGVVEKSTKKTYLITMNKPIKRGQNCLPYSHLIDFSESGGGSMNNKSNDETSSSMTSRTSISNDNKVITLDSTAAMMLSGGGDGGGVANKATPLPVLHTIPREVEKLAYSNRGSIVDSPYAFHDFIRLHRVNLSLCYANDSSICTQKVAVSDYNPDLSAYLTLVAVGCSAVLIFFILLIASICCCCCRRSVSVVGQNGKKKHKGVGLKNDLNSKLVIKSFPIVTNQQSKDYDYSDESTKSSQHHILNTSQTNGIIVSGGSGTSSGANSSGSSSFNEKTTTTAAAAAAYYHHHHHHMLHHAAMAPPPPATPADVTLFAAAAASSSMVHSHSNNNNNNNHHHHHHHVSSIATVESDASSSTSIENKTTSTSQGGNTSSQAHSPYTLTEPTNTTLTTPTPIVSSFQQHKYMLPPPTNHNNVYIKTYRQTHDASIGVDTSSSYTTVTPGSSSATGGTSKKLVYEVIV